MRKDVHVRGAAGIMTREDTLELRDAISVRGLQSSQKRAIEICRVVFVAIAGTDDAAVDAGGVAVPEIPHEVRDGVAGVDVDELGIDDNIEAGFGFGDVGADVLALNPEGADFSFGGEDTGGVAVDDLFYAWCVWCDVES